MSNSNGKPAEQLTFAQRAAEALNDYEALKISWVEVLEALGVTYVEAQDRYVATEEIAQS